MITYDGYIQEWSGRQITKYGGECVAGVAEYEAENNLPIVYGDAHTWINNPVMLTRYNWIQNDPNDPNQNPNRGDIVVWPLPNEHIAFFDHNLGDSQFMSFGQNSGGITMHFQSHSWAGVAGWFVLRIAATPLPPTPPYTTENIPIKTVVINKETQRYNIDHANLADIMSDVVGVGHIGDRFDTGLIAHHECGVDFYIQLNNTFTVPNGFKVEDCNDYVPPAPLPPPSAPITIPVAPKHTVTYAVSGFTDATSAANNVDPQGTIEPGTYYVYNVYPGKSNLINVSTVNGKAGSWINTDDDVAPKTPLPPFEPPAPTIPEPPVTSPQDGVSTWKSTYNPFNPPRGYVAMEKFTIEDYSGRAAPITIPQYFGSSNQGFSIHGSFVVNNNMYGRIQVKNDPDFELYYGVPLMEDGKDPHLVELYSELYSTKTDTASRIVTKTTTLKDHVIIGIESVEKVMDTVLRKKKK